MGAALTVPLEVQIAHKLADFTLDVNFVAADEPLSVLGPSGAGKSMLLRCIAGLERAGRGRIVLNGRTLLDSEKKIHLPARERRVGMLFQHYGLFPHRTLAENIAFGIQQLPLGERGPRVAALVERAHLSGLENRYPREVSGGEQQRAALARALAIEPEALLLDEPLSALDAHLRSQMEAELQSAFDRYARPSLLVTHNVEEAYRLGKRLLVLSRGRIAAFGDKDDIFLRPPSLEVARLTGCKNFSRVRLIDRQCIEAIDWHCRVRVAQIPSAAPAYVGIRAHHVRFVDADERGEQAENAFPCWLVRASQTPFRVTLYLRLIPPTKSTEKKDEFDLQVEVTRERWARLRDQPEPFRVMLPPDALFLVSE